MFTPTRGIPYNVVHNGELESSGDPFWAEVCTSSTDSAAARRTRQVARKAYMINAMTSRIDKARFPDFDEDDL